MYQNLFILSFIDSNLDCFHRVIIMNDADINTGKCSWSLCVNSFGYTLADEDAGFHSHFVLSF
jgi:hypothetical protein